MAKNGSFELVVGGRRVMVDLESEEVNVLGADGKVASSLPLQVAAGSVQGGFFDESDDTVRQADNRFGEF